MNFDDYETLPTNDVILHMNAGAIAGIMEHCVMYPLDSVKTRLQSIANVSNNLGIRQTLSRMIETEGFLRPVRGVSVVVAGAGPAHALYFSCYESVKENLIRHTSLQSYQSVAIGLSGCVSTLIHDAIMTPTEVIKQRMQMYNSPYRSVLDCMFKTYRTEGIKAFYRSYTTQLTMNIPFQSIHFLTYEWTQKYLNPERKYNPKAHMLSGALAGAVAAASTTPLDVCKTLLNTQQNLKPEGLLDAISIVYRVGGPTAYFRGILARVMYQMPATAICWSTYEFFKYFLRNFYSGISDNNIFKYEF